MVRPAYLRMLFEVKRFHREAHRLLDEGSDEVTLGQFLTTGGYSAYFIQHFMVPVVSCVWSTHRTPHWATPLATSSRSSTTTAAGGHRSPEWRTVVGGSRSYVEKAVKGLTSVRLATPVRAITRHADGVTVRADDDQTETFERIVIATHADTALYLLADPTDAERQVLGAFGYSRNHTVLHNDRSLLPQASRALASWNYLMPACATSSADVVVSYDMNRLRTCRRRRPTSSPSTRLIASPPGR